MKRIHQDNSPDATFSEPVNCLIFPEKASRMKERVQSALLSEYLPKADCPYKRGQQDRRDQ